MAENLQAVLEEAIRLRPEEVSFEDLKSNEAKTLYKIVDTIEKHVNPQLDDMTKALFQPLMALIKNCAIKVDADDESKERAKKFIGELKECLHGNN